MRGGGGWSGELLVPGGTNLTDHPVEDFIPSLCQSILGLREVMMGNGEPKQSGCIDCALLEIGTDILGSVEIACIADAVIGRGDTSYQRVQRALLSIREWPNVQ